MKHNIIIHHRCYNVSYIYYCPFYRWPVTVTINKHQWEVVTEQFSCFVCYGVQSKAIWCSKQSHFILESFHRAAGELCLSKVSTYWGQAIPGSWRQELTAHAFCLLPTEPVSIRQNPSKKQWCQAPTRVSHVLWVWCRNYCRPIVQHKLPCVLSTTLYRCSEKVKMLLADAPTNYLPTIYLIPTSGGFLRVSGSGQPLAIFSTFWHQRTSWWVCPVTLVFVNCYSDWTPAKGTTVDVRDIVTCMMHYDVMFHLVFVYMGMTCASLSVVLVFEAKQSYFQIVSWGCGRTMRIESVITCIVSNNCG